MLRHLISALCLVLAGCAGLGSKLPDAPGPADARLVSDQPLECGSELLYLHVFDMDPATEAAVMVVGPVTRAHEHSDPFLVVVIDAGGKATFYLSVDGRVSVLSVAEWDARYGDHKVSSICRARTEKRV
jgi:hypothetical protein